MRGIVELWTVAKEKFCGYRTAGSIILIPVTNQISTRGPFPASDRKAIRKDPHGKPYATKTRDDS